MRKKLTKKLVHVGKYVAEVEVELSETEDGWTPYLSVNDAYKLDDVRDALRQNDIKTALRYGKVYTLTPISE